MKFKDPRLAAFMANTMSKIYANFGGTGAGGLQYNTVIDEVELAIENQDFSDLDRKYGLDIGPE